MAEFVPANPLEKVLLDAQQGKVPPSGLFDTLVSSPVFVLLNQPLAQTGTWVEGTELLVLDNPAGAKVIAVFSAPERAEMWYEIATGFGHGMNVDFRWILGGIAAEVGIALNPGSDVGLEMSAELVKKLQASVASH